MEENTQLQQTAQIEKLTDWPNEPTLLTLKADFEAAKPFHDTQKNKIIGWNNLLHAKGEAKPPVVKGRSQVQPKLVRRQAEWRYSALSEPFLSSHKLYKISPSTFEDTAAARQNELLLNWQFRTKINRVKFIDDYVRSVVDDGTCIVRTSWRRVIKKVKVEMPVWDHYPVTAQDQIDTLQQAIALKQENPRGYDEQVPPDIKASVDYFEETGEPTVAIQNGIQMVDTDKIIENHPEAEILNPANVYFDPSCNGDWEKALFVVVSFETNKAELEKEGKKYTNLDKVDWASNTPTTSIDHVSPSTNTNFAFKDPARKKVVAYEYWGYFDVNGDGKLIPFVATWIGNTIIRMEMNPFPDEKIPIVVVPYMPKKRDLYGEPDAELLGDNQAILGAVTRGMIDLMGRSANGQQGFAKGMLDPLNRRRFENGQDYEFNPNVNPNAGHIEHKYPEIPQSAMLMLTMQNQEAEALTGVKSFSGGMSGETYGDVAAGIRGVLDAAAKREMSILRRCAKGLQHIGYKFAAMNSEFLSEEEVVRVTNEEYVTVKREDLKGNFDLDVDICTAEVDDMKAKDMGFMLQTLGPNMDPAITTMILSEIAELKRMPLLAHKLKNWQPTPDPVQQQLQQLELQKAQMEIKKLESDIALNQAKAAQVTAMKDKTNLDFVEQETGTTHARAMEQSQAQARANQALEVTKGLVKPVKEGERKPDIAAAVGFNHMTDLMDKAENSPAQNNPMGQPQINVDPQSNLNYVPTE